MPYPDPVHGVPAIAITADLHPPAGLNRCAGVYIIDPTATTDCIPIVYARTHDEPGTLLPQDPPRWLYLWDDPSDDVSTGWWFADAVGADDYFAFCQGKRASPEGCPGWTNHNGAVNGLAITSPAAVAELLSVTSEDATLAGTYQLDMEAATTIIPTVYMRKSDAGPARWLYLWDDPSDNVSTGWWFADAVGADDYFAFCQGKRASPEGCPGWTNHNGAVNGLAITSPAAVAELLSVTSEDATLAGTYQLDMEAATTIIPTVYMRMVGSAPKARELHGVQLTSHDGTVTSTSPEPPKEVGKCLYFWDDPADMAHTCTGWWLADTVGADEYFAACFGRDTYPEKCQAWDRDGTAVTLNVVRVDQTMVRVGLPTAVLRLAARYLSVCRRRPCDAFCRDSAIRVAAAAHVPQCTLGVKPTTTSTAATFDRCRPPSALPSLLPVTAF